MAGGNARFEGNILHNITHFMDMDFIGFGDNRIQGETLVFGSLKQGLYLKAVCRTGASRESTFWTVTRSAA